MTSDERMDLVNRALEHVRTGSGAPAVVIIPMNQRIP
jgi:hypothetical protein